MGKDNMSEENNFGLTEQEEEMDLHDYNHALFQNMMFFLDTAWEINLLTDTALILHDRNEPDKSNTEIPYREAFRDYAENRTSRSERPVFEQHLAPENLKKLEREVFFDIHLRRKDNGWNLYRIVLTPAFDRYGKLSRVYLGARNLETEIMQVEAPGETYEATGFSNVAKSEFLAQISHDIRTPLNTIIGMTAIAEKHQDNEERMTECLKKISLSSKYLLSLVDDMFDMSIIESGKMKLQEEEVDLAELFEDLGILLGMRVKERGHEFSAEILHIEHKKVLGDRHRIGQIIVNLVENAAKYIVTKGKVGMTLEEKPSDKQGMGCYEIIVQDNGVGVAPELVERMFDPFAHAKDHHEDNVQGSGLGLAIIHNFIQMMNGVIYVKSEPGKGMKAITKIYLKLSGSQRSHLFQSMAGEEAGKNEKSPIETLAERDFSGNRVLMVEDNESNADIIREILKMVGLEVEHAWNGKEAVEKIAAAEDWYYNIVFMDIQMPVMDGYEAARAIRGMKRPYAKEVPILAMSANAYAEDIHASLMVGMNEHISKPIDFRKLEESLCRWLPDRK